MPAVKLASAPYGKIWGSPLTEPWYPNPERRNIGEVWFAASPAVPLLVKLLFTSDKLSVQVHPGDAYAREHEKNWCGKTEMWHVLRAEPAARVALGLREAITPERLRAASLSGDIEQLLNWVPARRGDTFFIPAGTIHAIGAGLALCEVQQFSDVTYRLYDYGRGRELHLDRGLAVSHLEPRECAVPLPVECDYFRTEKLIVKDVAKRPSPRRNTIYIAVEGEGSIAGEPFTTGEAWEIPAGSESFEIVSPEAAFLIASEP